MSNTIRFVLVLHNHQPIGNFDHVFEQAYQDSYLPFLDVFEPLRVAEDRPAHQRLADGVARRAASRVCRSPGRGWSPRAGSRSSAAPFYEPILAMIPRRDRVGQIRSYTRWLEHRLGAQVRGMWMPERVWEQSMTSDLVAAGIEYTVLDDFHFKNAGLAEDQLHGYYLTEDDGNVLAVFPGSEPLRYLIPFRRAAGDDRLPGQRGRAAARRGRRVRRRRREVRHLARDEEARLRRRLAGAASSTCWSQNHELDPSRSRRPKRSTARRRSARSICPTAATAR